MSAHGEIPDYSDRDVFVLSTEETSAVAQRYRVGVPQTLTLVIEQVLHSERGPKDINEFRSRRCVRIS